MRFRILESVRRHVVVDRGNDEFTSFPADTDNDYYLAFLALHSFTHTQIQEMEPDAWYSVESIEQADHLTVEGDV